MEQQGTPAQQIFFGHLHKMITNEAITKSGCIVWLPDGLGFSIPSKQAFIDNILPRYFGHSKFVSFTRRLKRWGFVRQNSGGFYHTQFKRDMVFEDDYDDYDVDANIKRQHPPPLVNVNVSSLSKGPLKKRFKQRLSSPPPSSDLGVFLPSNKASDIHIMPELMRVINRNKRKRNEGPTEIVSENSEEIMIARTLASLELKVRKKSSPFGVECSQPSVPIYLVKPNMFSRAA